MPYLEDMKPDTASNQQVHATVYIDNGQPLPGTLTESQHIDYVTSALPRPNPAWTYTDRNGHFHAYDHRDERDRYPTMHRRVEHVECAGSHDPDDDDCEGYNQTRYLCRICDEDIRPGLLHGEHTTPILGLKEWAVTVDTALPRLGQLGEQVSVRAETLRAVYFGVAVVTNQRLDSDGTGELELLGNGPLGSRRRGAPPCPVCGASVRVERIDVTGPADLGKVYVLGGETRCTANALHDVAEVALEWANGEDR